MSVLRLAALAIMLCAVSAAAPQDRVPPQAADPSDEAAERGWRLADYACADCHAIGRTDASPLAAAPPFRDIVHRHRLEDLERGFAEGLVTAHPAMPTFVFRASEIDDLIAYLEQLKAPQ